MNVPQTHITAMITQLVKIALETSTATVTLVSMEMAPFVKVS